jgi:AcrR family transcriptional regulator
MALSEEVLARRHAGRQVEIVERVLPVIEELLDEEPSYLDVPVERIIARAELSRTTFYRHFKDKNQLLRALCDRVLVDLREASMETWRLPLAASRSEFESALRRSVMAYLPHQRLITAMFEVASYDPEMKQRLNDAYGGLRDTVAAYLNAGQDAGLVRPGLHPREFAGWMTWMAERGLQQLVGAAGSVDEVDRLIESLSDVIWYTAFAGQGRVDDIGR